MSPKDLLRYYQKLLRKHGSPEDYWPQWCARNKSLEEREKIIIGMILVQRTSWHNAEIALKNLKKAGLLSIKNIANLKDLQRLTQLIRPAGFYQSKPQRLFDLCTFFDKQGGVETLMEKSVETLRQQLLKIKGVGQETADTILLYALDKPVFVIDAYTRRWVEKSNLTREKDYTKLQQFFHDNLKSDQVVYRNYHALIIIEQKGGRASQMAVI